MVQDRYIKGPNTCTIGSKSQGKQVGKVPCTITHVLEASGYRKMAEKA